nr:hypothetical protein CFP56_00401 [Quercus suber]
MSQVREPNNIVLVLVVCSTTSRSSSARYGRPVRHWTVVLWLWGDIGTAMVKFLEACDDLRCNPRLLGLRSQDPTLSEADSYIAIDYLSVPTTE